MVVTVVVVPVVIVLVIVVVACVLFGSAPASSTAAPMPSASNAANATPHARRLLYFPIEPPFRKTPTPRWMAPKPGVRSAGATHEPRRRRRRPGGTAEDAVSAADGG